MTEETKKEQAEGGEEKQKETDPKTKAKLLVKRLVKELDEGSGTINGIGIASFLHMAEQNKTSCTLNIRFGEEFGTFFVAGGKLIDAEYGVMSAPEGAGEILSWTGTEIELVDDCDRSEDRIGQPLIRVLTAGLKLRKKRPPVQPSEPDNGEEDISEEEPGKKKKGKKKGKKKKDKKRKSKVKEAKPRSIKKLAFIGLLVAAVIGGGAFYYMRMTQARQQEESFQEMMSQVGRQKDPGKAIAILEGYIKSQEPSDFTIQAEQKIKQVEKRLETRDFKAIVKEVEELPVDLNYEASARAIYSNFIKKYPNSSRSKNVQKLIDTIPEKIDDLHYERVEAAEKQGVDVKLVAYREYLEQHPEGKHSKAVRKAVFGIRETTFENLSLAIPKCEKQKDWDRCIRYCESYITAFKSDETAKEVMQWKLGLEEARDLDALRAKVAGLGTDYLAAYQLYQDHLKRYPKAAADRDFERQKAQLKERVDAETKWQGVLAYCTNKTAGIGDRINKLSRYMGEDRTGYHREDAERLMKQLTAERRSVSRTQVATGKPAAVATQPGRTAASSVQKPAAESADTKRLNRLTAQVSASLGKASGRFDSNGDGTFQDTHTGLTWCLLDSRQVLNKCQDYEAAKKYVADLTTGGYTDWRLPTPAELGALYKRKPYFPSSGEAWYWSSKLLVTGYHWEAVTITSKPENSFLPKNRDVKKCGTVRAVR